MSKKDNRLNRPRSDYSFRDYLTTVTANGKAKWNVPNKPGGKWFNRRTAVTIFYYAAFFSIPFININGRPLILIDVLNGKFVLFGKAFWPQDFFIFGLIMVALIIFIAVFTLAFGRIFCGWICPQTIFMEMLFRRVDYLIFGSAAKHRSWINKPWTSKKIQLFTLRYFIYAILSFIIGNTFLAYFIGVEELFKIMSEPISMHLVGFIMMLTFTAIFFSVFVFLREQVCTNICPYGRLQSVLLDRHSIVVAYDYKRGEPRGKFKKDQGDMGDCIDCFQCVDVCPTGIDIRNGTQLECVNCTACIDACDFMMLKVNRPTGLIRYASEFEIQHGKKFSFTPRLKMLTAVLVVLLTGIVLLLASRSNVTGQMIRTAGMLYQERGEDSISNLYNLKLINKTLEDKRLSLKLENSKGTIQYVGKDYIDGKAEEQSSATFFVVLPKSEVKDRKNTIKVGLYEGGNKLKDLKATFLGPITRSEIN